MKLRRVFALGIPLLVAACNTTEDTGAMAARMEQQDDTACERQAAGKGTAAYQQCRKNLFAYRQQALVEQQQAQARREAVADGLAAAGRAMQSIDPQPVNVNVTCTFGCR